MPTGRVPPHDLDAEAAVLSACMLSAAALDEVADLLRPHHLYTAEHQRIWGAVLQLHAAGQPVDAVTVAQSLRAAGQLDAVGGTVALGRLVDETPAVAHVREHAEIVVQLWRVRRTIEAAHLVASDGYDQGAADAADYLAGAEQRMWDATSERAASGGLAPIKDALVEVFSDMAAGKQQRRGTTTGLADYDALTTGMHAGDLIIVAARPGMGKTGLATGVAEHVAGLGLWVPFFSLEMQKDQVAGRITCAAAGVDLKRFREARLGAQDFAELTREAARLATLPLHIDDSSGLDVAAIRNRSRRLAAQAERAGSKVGLVVVDYLQLMRHPVERGGTRDSAIGETTRALKGLAKDLGCPVMVLSQLNREVDRRAGKQRGRPQLSDLRESGNIEQDADTVVFVYRGDYYRQQDDDPERDGLAELLVAKQRNGPCGKVVVRFKAECARFMSIAPGTW